ncbi:hypothetical protein ACH4FA_02430 [Streptomyces sp. NPDC017966]
MTPRRAAGWDGRVTYEAVALDTALTVFDAMASKFSRKKPVLV